MNTIKLKIKKVTAALLSMTFIYSAMTPSINSNLLKPTHIADAASSCVSFDEATGTLPLSGNVVNEEVEELLNNYYVHEVICDEGTVFPSACSYMFIESKMLIQASNYRRNNLKY